jgi:hypothetical protein
MVREERLTNAPYGSTVGMWYSAMIVAACAFSFSTRSFCTVPHMNGVVNAKSSLACVPAVCATSLAACFVGRVGYV